MQRNALTVYIFFFLLNTFRSQSLLFQGRQTEVSASCTSSSSCALNSCTLWRVYCQFFENKNVRGNWLLKCLLYLMKTISFVRWKLNALAFFSKNCIHHMSALQTHRGVLLLRAVKWLKLMAVSYQPAQFCQFFLVLA